VPIVLKSGSLNLLEPPGPVQPCNGIALPLPLPLNTKPAHFLHKANVTKYKGVWRVLIDSMVQSTNGGTDDVCVSCPDYYGAFYGIPGFITVFSVSTTGPIPDILHRHQTLLHLSKPIFSSFHPYIPRSLSLDFASKIDLFKDISDGKTRRKTWTATWRR